jgi:antitoxin ParD1/3/4
MAILTVSLPDEVKAFIDTQVAAAGYASPGEYLHALIRDAQKRQAQQSLETKLLEGLQGSPVEMTRGDWEAVRREAVAGLDSNDIRP